MQHASSLRVSDSLPQAVCEHVKAVAAKAIAERGLFKVAISGGSLPKNLLPLTEDAAVDLSKWRVFFVDERYVPLDHKDSNYAGASAFVGKFAPEHVFPIDPSLPLAQCAQAYGKLLLDQEAAVLDLILLGMGEDGHTASLFPGHPLLREEQLLVAPISDSPKPPPERVTMTLRVIADARHIAFVAGGSGKQEPLLWIFREQKDVPSGLVLQRRPDALFFVDTTAAAKL